MEMFYISKAFNYELKKPKESQEWEKLFQSSLNEKVIKGGDRQVQIAHR